MPEDMYSPGGGLVVPIKTERTLSCGQCGTYHAKLRIELHDFINLYDLYDKAPGYDPKPYDTIQCRICGWGLVIDGRMIT